MTAKMQMYFIIISFHQILHEQIHFYSMAHPLLEVLDEIIWEEVTGRFSWVFKLYFSAWHD